MANKSYNEIPNLSEDWGLDPRNGLPYAGQSVQEFIKKTIREMMAEIGSKHGDVDFDGGTLRFYDTEGGKQLGAVTITGTSYSVNVVTNIPSSNFTVLTSDESYPVTLSATTTATEFGQTEGTNYPESYTYAIEVDNGMGYIDRTPENNAIAEGGTATVDLRPLLKVGTNRIRIIVTGASSNQPKTIGYTATLTSLSLRIEHPWHQVWNQGEFYAINNIFFSGNVAKTLHVKVDGIEVEDDKGNKGITYPASASFDKVPTAFDLTNYTPEMSGVVPIEIWMTGDGVETKHIYYNIMYVAKEDAGKISLICINNEKDKVFNFAQERLFEYAVYGISSITTSIKATYNDVVIEYPTNTSNIVAQTPTPFDFSLNIDTQEQAGISLIVNLSAENVEVEKVFDVDNSNAYLATDGYKFYLNTSLGNNDSADRELIPNAAIIADDNYKAVYNATWDNFTFADDAWGKDTDGNRALVVKAGSRLSIPQLKPLSASQHDKYSQCTFEFMYRASNIADYDTPILTCIDTEEYDPATSVGLVVFPTKVLLLGNSGARGELFQQLPLSENRIHHVSVVILRNYAGSLYNLAKIYINGCENVTFSFGGDLFFGNNYSYLRMGQQSTDTYLYMARIYSRALESHEVFANYLNALIETADVKRSGLREDNSITDGGISYDLCKKAGFNCFVIETDLAIPNVKNQVEYKQDKENGYKTGINFHLEYNDHPEWNVSIYDAPLDGQGTTSKKYYYWNLRSKIKESLRWVYPNMRDAQGEVLEEKGKGGYIAGYGLNPKVSRITWKKNIASQPQGHKMGATSLYNDLYKRVMGGASKLVDDKILPTEGARVAVYQHPFMGFVKDSAGNYTFIGLFTGGPDKGDKSTFGYDATDEYPSLMMVEGPNHIPLLTRFIVPWTEDVFYDYTQETLCVGTPYASQGESEEGWDADVVADYSSDKESDAAAILALYKSEFKPAYDAVFYNSPYIASVAESGKTIEEMNSNISGFRSSKTNGIRNDLMTFYNENYELVYYRVKTKQYEVLPKSTHDMLSYLGLSGTPTTEDILAARKAQWKTKVGEFVNLREAFYRQAFDEFIGASDNDAKNSYWRKFLSVKDGGKWGFNEDDLDTIFQNDNNGQDTKQYYIEPDDVSALGVDVFQGRTSAFWYALRQNCPDEIRGMMTEVVDAMMDEANAKSLNADSKQQTVFNLIDFYFWRHSSKYFPATAYNQDTQYAYIDVWYQSPNETYNGVPPLTQIHGDHYEAEREWVEKRIAYMFSKYQVGAFAGSEADGYGSMDFTPVEPFTMKVKPAIDLYPRISAGGGKTVTSQRTKAGEECPLHLDGEGETTFYLKGLDWLSDLGDLSGLVLGARSTADGSVVKLSIIGKRIRSLKVGDKDKTSNEIKFNAAQLAVESEALEVLDARNASSVSGHISLQKCPRTREVYLGGTSLSSVIPPTGGRIVELHLPDTIKDFILDNLNLLEEDGIVVSDAALANVQNLYIHSCDHINPADIVGKIYGLEGNKLKAISVVWKGTIVDEDGSALRAFGEIAENIGNYCSCDLGPAGLTPKLSAVPTVLGTLDATSLGGVYQKDIDNITAAFGKNLTVLYDPTKLYMWFDDQAVLDVLLANMKSAGYIPQDAQGITTTQAAAVTNIGNWFKGNTTIETFKEFDKFNSVKYIWDPTLTASNDYGAFSGCSNLKAIKLPNGIETIGARAFSNCTSLVDINIPKSVKSIGNRAFVNVPANFVLNLPNYEGILYQMTFDRSGIYKIENLGRCTELQNGIIYQNSSYGCFSKCTSLVSAILPDSLVKIGDRAFVECTSLSDIVYNWDALVTIGIMAFHGCTSLEIEELNLPNLTSLGQNAFNGVKIKKLVLGKLTDLPTATSNSQHYGDKNVLETVVLPDSITSIGEYSFYGYNALRKIILPSGLLSFAGRNIFNGCSSLSFDAANLPKSITTVGYMALNGFTGLYGELSLPNLTTIGEGAFRNTKISKVLNLGKIESTTEGDGNGGTFGNCTSLKHIELPETLRNLNRAFLYNCPNIETMIVRAVAPPNFNTTQNSVGAAIYVPDESVEAYKNATGWSSYANKIKPLSEYVES